MAKPFRVLKSDTCFIKMICVCVCEGKLLYKLDEMALFCCDPHQSLCLVSISVSLLIFVSFLSYD